MATSPATASPSAGRSNAMAWWSAGTILLSAFLLFQVQPIISKKILPWFGGSPAVWTTCVLFFQLALLGGYAYSHWIINKVPLRRQGIIHASLLLLALATLPFFPPWNFWKPADGNYPAPRIMLLLLCVVGASYFLLSTTGPLVQAWFAKLYPGRSPYRLYALSNVGSLFALLSYPFLFETNLMVDTQGHLWSLAFVVFGILIGIMALTMWRESQTTLADVAEKPVVQKPVPAAASKPAKPGQSPAPAPTADEPPSLLLRVGWLALAGTATMTFLAFTNHLCQDIAVVPFMWVIPLSLYLLTFIITFEYERFYVRWLFGGLAVITTLWLVAMVNYSAVDEALEKPQRFVAAALWRPELKTQEEIDAYAKKTFWEKMEASKAVFPFAFSKTQNVAFWCLEKVSLLVDKVLPGDQKFTCEMSDFSDHVLAQSASFMIVLFFVCLACHGELVKSKPQPKHLTTFYLFISLGGALGGLFVGLICPMIFKSHFELAMSLIGGFIVGWVAIYNAGRYSALRSREVLQWVFAFCAVGSTLLLAKATIEATEPDRVLKLLPPAMRERIISWKLFAKPDDDVIGRDRNFYGTVFVEKLGDWSDESNPDAGLALYNGRIWHGFQYRDPARQLEPTTYYVPGTGAALAVMRHPKRLRGEGMKVGIIGLGTGSMAAHGKEGDKFYFYDIDPKIVKFARQYFTYLDKSPAKPEVILGDARIKMEEELKEGSNNYDVIVLDAFSGDAIPSHLLTKESFALYDKHLAPGGVIVIHISNRYIDLEPVVKAIADKFDYKTVNVHAPGDGSAVADTASDWVLVTKNEEYLKDPEVANAGEPLNPKKEILWTDQFTALWSILK